MPSFDECCVFFNHRKLLNFTRGLFLGYGYLLWSVFSLLLGASTGNLSQSFFDTCSVGA